MFLLFKCSLGQALVAFHYVIEEFAPLVGGARLVDTLDTFVCVKLLFNYVQMWMMILGVLWLDV